MSREAKHIEKVEYDTDIIKYYITAEFTMYFDPSYGADIDGNRGVPRWEIDEIIIKKIEDQDGNNIPPERLKMETLDKLCDHALRVAKF